MNQRYNRWLHPPYATYYANFTGNPCRATVNQGTPPLIQILFKQNVLVLKVQVTLPYDVNTLPTMYDAYTLYNIYAI